MHFIDFQQLKIIWIIFKIKYEFSNFAINYKWFSTNISYENFTPFISALLFIPSILYCQDKLITQDENIEEVKIELIDQTTIKYKKFNNLKGPDYVIDKREVVRIEFENGSIEIIEPDSSSSKIANSKIKEQIVELINKHGFERKAYSQRYTASFEGDF